MLCLETDNVSSRLKYALFLDTTVHVIFPCILVHTQCMTKYKISSFSTENLQKKKPTNLRSTQLHLLCYLEKEEVVVLGKSDFSYSQRVSLPSSQDLSPAIFIDLSQKMNV